MKRQILLVTMLLTISAGARASILDETISGDVNRSSRHLDCRLENMDYADYASYSQIQIGTDFGDDSPHAVAFDKNGKTVASAVLGDFADFDDLNMRVFEIEDYEADTLISLIIVYKKTGNEITAHGVLTGNGQQNPVVRSAKMNCKYLGPLTIN